MHNKLFLLAVTAFFLCIGGVQAQDLGALGTQKPFAVKGAVQLRGIFYSASGTAYAENPFSYIFSGNLNFSIYGISLPVSFSLGQQGQSFSQPFNQFGASPHYKWITIHLGYRNINFSPYTLAGYTMLGAGIELTPGKFRFGLMYGRLNRATTLDTATQSLAPISFTRKALAVKMGYGTSNNFIDLSLLKGKDDPGSVSVNKNTLDSLNVLPAANTVIGISARLTLMKNILFEADAATSLYTSDINSPISLDSVNDPLVKKIGSIVSINGTSAITSALNLALGYKEKYYTIKLQYQRIDPDFISMGAYFFNSDLESYSIAPSFHAFKNKLRFNGSIGFQHDNVQHQKEATTQKIIGTALLSADFTKQFGIDVNFSNFLNNQQPQTIRFADSLKIVQNTQNLSVSPRFILSNSVESHTVVLSANMMQMNDFNNYFAQNAISRNINYKQVYLNYTYGYFPAKFSVFANLSTTDAEAPGTSDTNWGGTLGINKTFRSVFLVSVSGGYFIGKRSGINEHTTNASANFQFKFWKKHSLNALFFYTDDKPQNISQLEPAFSELRAELAYNYSF